MISAIIKKSVEKSVFTIVAAIALLAGGWAAYLALPIDAVPDITNVQVQVITPVPALTPDTIETSVTYPIENAMNSIPGTTEVRSITRYGLSHVTVIFDEGYDLYRARQLVAEKVQTINLPEGLTPSLGPISTGLGEIYHYSLEASRWKKDPDSRLMQLMELRTLQEWVIKPRLLSVKGVTEVNTIGGYPKQFHVRPRPELMRTYGIHFDDITAAIRESSFNTGGGFIQQSAEQLLVQGSGLVRSVADIKNISVKLLQDFRVITVGDIADVAPGREIRTGAAVVNGEESIVGSVFMLLGANSRTVSRDVDSRIREIRSALPPWVRLRTLYDRSDLVENTLLTVQQNLGYGALLVVLILFFLIGNARVALITAVTIPLSLAGTFIFMRLADIPGSLMSLGALDFGIIIDGAVIVMDSCARSVAEAADRKGSLLSRAEVKEAVSAAAVDIRRAAGFGQLIIAVVFIPLFALSGVEGRMFRPMAFGFCFALVSSFLLSFTVVPALAGTFLTGKPGTGSSRLLRLLERGYAPVLATALRFRLPVAAAVLALVTVSGIIFARMGSEFIPRLDEGALAMQFIRPVNISAERSLQLEMMGQKIIRGFPEVKEVFSRLGAAEITVDPAGINHGDTFITLKDRAVWPKIHGHRRSMEELAAAMYNELRASVPGQRILLSQPIELRFNELLEGVRSDIALKIYGSDMKTLESIGAQAAAVIRAIPGAGDVESEMRGTSPILSVTPKMDLLNRLGIPKSSVLNAVKIAIGGEEAGYLYEGVRKFPVIVRLPDQVREHLGTLRNIPIGAAPGFTVPLSSVADMVIHDQYSSIIRDSSQRRTAVMINIRGRDMEGFVNEARETVNRELRLPAGYYTEWGGNFKNLESAKQRLMLLVPLTLFLVFFMIYSAFGNAAQTFLVFLGIPFALAGGVLGLLIMGLPFSISAGVGFIALSGIAVLNGVVLISYYNRLRDAGEHGAALVKKGALLRFRPVMMTAMTDILGFLPMMIATGTGAGVQKPLASVVVGGVFTSTMLTLVMLPVLYRTFEARMKRPAL